MGTNATFAPHGRHEAAHAESATCCSLLARADCERDGSYRVVASKALPGRPIGRIQFFGTRPDDPNDLVAHENRRELRGYGVFAAWLNHWDAKALNTLDTLVAVDGRSIVRHHLIDFGSALGSAGLGPGEDRAGGEGRGRTRAHGKARGDLGVLCAPLAHRAALRVQHRGAPSGRKHGVRPQCGRPRIPNRAFLSARADDRFWAARKIVAMRADLIRAAVAAGQFDDPEGETFLVKALVERRDAIARAYLTTVNPIADPMLDYEGLLTFINVAVDADVARAPRGYRAVWFYVRQRNGRHRAVRRNLGTDNVAPGARQPPHGRPDLHQGGAQRRGRLRALMGDTGGCLFPEAAWSVATGGVRTASVNWSFGLFAIRSRSPKPDDPTHLHDSAGAAMASGGERRRVPRAGATPVRSKEHWRHTGWRWRGPEPGNS